VTRACKKEKEKKGKRKEKDFNVYF